MKTIDEKIDQRHLDILEVTNYEIIKNDHQEKMINKINKNQKQKFIKGFKNEEISQNISF